MAVPEIHHHDDRDAIGTRSSKGTEGPFRRTWQCRAAMRGRVCRWAGGVQTPQAGLGDERKIELDGHRILLAIQAHFDRYGLGIVFRGAEDQGFQCFPRKPLQVRKPDVSFVRRDVALVPLRDSGWTPEVPELIVEVLSPKDGMTDIESRIGDFLSAGTKLIWIVDPVLEIAFVIHPDGIRYPLGSTDSFDGEDVLPGFRLPLVDVLPPNPPR
jgi:hypothetical protein